MPSSPLAASVSPSAGVIGMQFHVWLGENICRLHNFASLLGQESVVKLRGQSQKVWVVEALISKESGSRRLGIQIFII